MKSEILGSTFIKEVYLLPSDVLHLIIKRPEKFQFKAGDYIRINIPVINVKEFHAFTISSAPENQGNNNMNKTYDLCMIRKLIFFFKDEIWLHIRKNGDWTNKLHQYFSDYSKLGYYVPIVRPKRTLKTLFQRFKQPKCS